MNFILLDGGVGQELHRRMGAPASPLWSAEAIEARPDLVEAVHVEFLRAGADVITLASYTVTPERLTRAGRKGAFKPLQDTALAAALRAREMVAVQARIAGCLPPLPGSYQPWAALSERAARDQYARITDAQAPGVDLFLCETMTTISEACQATETAAGSGLEVWTAFAVDERDATRLRGGECLVAAADAACRAGASRVLVNCSPPETTGVAVNTLLDAGFSTGGYANGFETVDPMAAGAMVNALSARRDLDPQAYADIAMGWARAGAEIVGGCCLISPAHIAEIARRRAASVVAVG